MNAAPSSERRRLSWSMLIGIAVVVGGGYAAWVVGARVVDPTDITWLANDPAQYFNGWAFLRAEPSWHFPPTYVERLGYPVGVSTALLNDTPLTALLFRLIERWLPTPFQYFGLFSVVCGVLQMAFGMAIARRWFAGRPLATVLAGVMFLLAPIFVFRLHGHFSLGAQWFVLAAFLIHESVEDRRLGHGHGLVAGALLLLWCAGGSHPYLLAMVSVILAAATARASLAGILQWPTALLIAAAGLGAGASSAWLHGFLTGGGQAALVGAGLGRYSLNLNALLNPQGAGSVLLPSLPILDGQGEGFAYLGLGGMILVAWALPVLLAGVIRAPWRGWLPLGTACVLMATFALSHQVTFGATELLRLPLPGWAAAVGGTFRASGRFVWPLWYAILLVALRAVAAIRPQRIGEVMLAVAVVLQVVDTNGLRRVVSTLLVPTRPPALASPEWATLSRAHDHLVVLPAWQCVDGHGSPGGVAGHGLFGRVAVTNGLTLNSFQAARYGDDLLAVHCHTLPRAFAARGPDARTAYVLDDAHARALAQHTPSTWGCSRVDGVVSCRQDAPEPGFAPVLRAELFAGAGTGDTVPLRPGATVLATGWRVRPGDVAAGRRWAGLAFRHTGAAEVPIAVVLVTETAPSPRSLRVRAVVDGVPRHGAIHGLDAGAGEVVVPLGRVPAGAIVGIGMRRIGPGNGPITARALRIDLAQ